MWLLAFRQVLPVHSNDHSVFLFTVQTSKQNSPNGSPRQRRCTNKALCWKHAIHVTSLQCSYHSFICSTYTILLSISGHTNSTLAQSKTILTALQSQKPYQRLCNTNGNYCSSLAGSPEEDSQTAMTCCLCVEVFKDTLFDGVRTPQFQL
jgi:hypothetical protein